MSEKYFDLTSDEDMSEDINEEVIHNIPAKRRRMNWWPNSV